jgi:hypothetical protein
VDELQRLLNERELAASRAVAACAKAVAHLNFGDTEKATEVLLFALADYRFIDERIIGFCETQRKRASNGNRTAA